MANRDNRDDLSLRTHFQNFYYSMNKIISDFNEIHRKIDKMPKNCLYIFLLNFLQTISIINKYIYFYIFIS